MTRRGVTLIELLIALAITMIMMGAVVTLFANMTTSVTDSRAVIEISERLRAARNLLQNDLAGHTAPTMPPLDPAAGLGFLELIEGQLYTDYGFVAAAAAPTTPAAYTGTGIPFTTGSPGIRNVYTTASQGTILGDVDDIVHLTVHSNDKPFVGRMNGVMMESQNAEIIWFALPNGRLLTNQNGTTTQLWTLYRRVLLVLPGYNLQGAGSIPGIYANYDISAHYDPVTNQTVANSLGDLTKRENRFYHGNPGANTPANFPYQLNRWNLWNPGSSAILTGTRLGEDVILDNVLSFDMRVFDPLAAFVKGVDGTMLGPCDPGYSQAGLTGIGALGSAGGMLGGFVDMAYAEYNTLTAPYSRNPFSFWKMNSYYSNGAAAVAYSQMALPGYATYDTWSLSYEHDGLDQDQHGIGVADQGFNGFDDNSMPNPTPPPQFLLPINGIIDDPWSVVVNYTAGLSIAPLPGERETMSPFPYPLRAVEVKLRVYESDSRQVRQVTVVQDFVPE
jgi:type II secretory pathway pseudopilin PulG